MSLHRNFMRFKVLALFNVGNEIKLSVSFASDRGRVISFINLLRLHIIVESPLEASCENITDNFIDEPRILVFNNFVCVTEFLRSQLAENRAFCIKEKIPDRISRIISRNQKNIVLILIFRGSIFPYYF